MPSLETPSNASRVFCKELLLTTQILHYLKDAKLWELWYVFIKGNAGFLSSTV